MVLMASMQIERRRVGDCWHNHQLDGGLLMQSTPPSKWSSPLVLQPCPFSSGGGRSSVGVGGIEHTVSKFDTLAGVAIKYGVEVADIKRMNGLTTDLQMFALKSLQIPLPGRHPPSPIMSNGSEETPVSDRHNSDLFNSIKSLKLSSSSQRNDNSLRGYYGCKPNDENEGFEMAVYREGGAIGVHRKSKSLIDELSDKEDGCDKSYDKLVRRRKSEVDLNDHHPDDNKRGLASRQKAGSQDAEQNLLTVETLTGVRKCSSTHEDFGKKISCTSTVCINASMNAQLVLWPVICRYAWWELCEVIFVESWYYEKDWKDYRRVKKDCHNGVMVWCFVYVNCICMGIIWWLWGPLCEVCSVHMGWLRRGAEFRCSKWRMRDCGSGNM